MPKSVSITRTKAARGLAQKGQLDSIPIECSQSPQWSVITSNQINFGVVRLRIDARLLQQCVLTHRVFLYRPTHNIVAEKGIGFRIYFASLKSVSRRPSWMNFECYYSPGVMEAWLIPSQVGNNEQVPELKIAQKAPGEGSHSIHISDGSQEVWMRTDA